jgi:uncharacterized protein YecE (DUF72 family)
LTSDFAYARLMRSEADCKTGYPSAALDAWADRARAWSSGDAPGYLPHVAKAVGRRRTRDVFVFFINGAKERAPAAARALLDRLNRAG